MESGSINADGIRFHYLAKGKGPMLPLRLPGSCDEINGIIAACLTGR